MNLPDLIPTQNGEHIHWLGHDLTPEQILALASLTDTIEKACRDAARQRQKRLDAEARAESVRLFREKHAEALWLDNDAAVYDTGKTLRVEHRAAPAWTDRNKHFRDTVRRAARGLDLPLWLSPLGGRVWHQMGDEGCCCRYGIDGRDVLHIGPTPPGKACAKVRAKRGGQ